MLGGNFSGQLGDGTGGEGKFSTTPVDVSGLTSSVAAVSAGLLHTCVLTTAGGLKCWGDGFGGALGNGTIASKPTPVDVAGFTSGAAAVSAGGQHTCAVTTEGGLKCWGDNFYGEVGDGTTMDRLTPVGVSGLASGVAAVSTWGDYTCVLTTVGGLKCWGENVDGQLGDGTTMDRLTPVDVIGFLGAAMPIPSASQWGLIVLAGMMATILLRRVGRVMSRVRA